MYTKAESTANIVNQDTQDAGGALIIHTAGHQDYQVKRFYRPGLGR